MHSSSIGQIFSQGATQRDETPAGAILDGMQHRATVAADVNFVAYCAWLLRRLPDTRGGHLDFPLRGRIRLRSNVSLVFSLSEVHACEVRDQDATLWLNLLTIAGIGGVLPHKVSEDILAAKRDGGDALHEFLDLINRRFWEILFQSYRIGTRPQYGFNNETARRLIYQLAEGCAGLRDVAALNAKAAHVNFNTHLLRYCFDVGRGPGSHVALTELLSRAISRPVRITERLACKVPVPQQYQAQLSANAHGSSRLHLTVLGKRAVLYQLLVVEVPFDAAQLGQFIPASGGAMLLALLGTLNIALVGRLAAVSMRYKVLMTETNAGWLGHSTFRLGWGAALGGSGAHTKFIQISTAAISAIKEKP